MDGSPSRFGAVVPTDWVVVSDEDPIEYAVTDSLTLAVRASPLSSGPAVHVSARCVAPTDGSDGETRPVVAETFTRAELSSSAARDRFAEALERLCPGEAASVRDGLDRPFDELVAAIDDGRLLEVDRAVACLLGATHTVEYRPDGDRPEWYVRLVDERSGTDAELYVPAREWASPDPGYLLDGRIPEGLGLVSPFHGHPERWQAVRSVWQRLAVARSAPASDRGRTAAEHEGTSERRSPEVDSSSTRESIETDGGRVVGLRSRAGRLVRGVLDDVVQYAFGDRSDPPSNRPY